MGFTDSNSASTTRIILAGKVFFAVGIIGIGIQHFIFNDFIPVMIPHWPNFIPARVFWVYLAGSILVAGGFLILSEKTTVMAAALLGILFLLSVIFFIYPKILCLI